MGRLSFGRDSEGRGRRGRAVRAGRARRLLKSVGSWMGEQARARGRGREAHAVPALRRAHAGAAAFRAGRGASRRRQTLPLPLLLLPPADAGQHQLDAALRAEALRWRRARLAKARVPPPEAVPAVGIYHPEAASHLRELRGLPTLARRARAASGVAAARSVEDRRAAADAHATSSAARAATTTRSSAPSSVRGWRCSPSSRPSWTTATPVRATS